MRFAGAGTGLRLGALLLACANATPAAEAQPAEQPAEKVRLRYRAPADCPSGETFVASVRARAGTEWEAAPDELARPLEVEVARNGPRYIASIHFSAGTGDSLRRQVTGQDCGEVVDGVALVTALAIRSRVSEAIERSEPVSAPLAAPSGPTERKPVRPEARPSRTPAAAEPLWLRVGVSGGVASGVGPELAFGAGVFGVVELSRLRLGLAARFSDSGEDEPSGVPVRFRLLSLRLEGCPAVAAAPWLSVEPCASFEAGSLLGETTREAPPRVTRLESATTPWAAPGALLRAVVRFAPGFLQLEGAARVPLVQERFYVEVGGDRHMLYEVPGVTGEASVGLGARF